MARSPRSGEMRLELRRAGELVVARKKTPPIRANVKALISSRLRLIRQELFGEHGGPELARRLNLPARTWYNYETGVTVPAEVLLSFIDQTGTNPIWLLSGEGSEVSTGRGRVQPREDDAPGVDPPGPREARGRSRRGAGSQDGVTDYFSLTLVPLSQVGRPPSARPRRGATSWPIGDGSRTRIRRSPPSSRTTR